MAARDAFHCEPTAVNWTEALNRFDTVRRATGVKTAALS